MGGLALKHTPTRRYEKAEFEIISTEIIDTLQKVFKRVEMPLFYKNKESFGDADILVSTDGFIGEIRDYITHTFQPNEIFHNGNCYSFDYKELQVDLITVSDARFDTYITYLSYNDLGNYIGKLAHGFGLKYGQDGLTYDHYFKGGVVGRVFISKDYRKIFDFLGLDYDRYLEGFDELVDIFKFIADSKYFNWEYLQLENNNKVNRDRDKKRKSYMSFLDYINENVKDDAHRYEYLKDKLKYLPVVEKTFPEANLELEIRRLEYEEARKLYVKAKFNGGMIIRKYGIEGVALGHAISGFNEFLHSRLDRSEFLDYFISTSTETIFKDFEQYLKTCEK